MTQQRMPVGTISIVEDHPARPYEIRVEDEYPVAGQSLAVRAGTLVEAAELLACYLEFEILRQGTCRHDHGAAAQASWRRLVEGYRGQLDIPDADLCECRIEVAGLILDPAGTWSPERPDVVPFLAANGRAG